MSKNRSRKNAVAKVISALLCVLLFLLLSSSVAFAALMGDVNEDGNVNVQDVILVQKDILSPKFTPAQKAVADVNGDGAINVRDATLIMQYSLKLITEFPVGPSTPGVKSVRAISADTIAVEFFDIPSVAEKAALTITIRNVSNLVVPTAVTWDNNVAKVSRLLGLSFNIGTYSVEVLGITPAYNGYVVVSSASAVNLVIEATSLPINTAVAPLRVKLLDQYGNELPMLNITFDRTAYNLTTHTPITVGFDPRAYFFINTTKRDPHEISFNVGDQIRVTFVHKATGIEETVVIPVTPEVQLGSITFGEVILPLTRTVLTKNLTNVRVPFTAKDQNGNPLVLIDGANVKLSSSDQSIISDSNLRFTWVAGEQQVLIERFLKKGHVIISVMGTPGGIVGNKFLNVEEGLPFELQVVTEPSTVLLPGASTTIRLRVIDQFGIPVNPAVASSDFEIVTIKSSRANINLSSPVHNKPYSLVEAGAGIRITSGGTSVGVYDEVTFRLQRTDGTFVDSVHRTIYVIRNYHSLFIQPDQLVDPYMAGDPIILNIKAMVDGRIHHEYNNTVRAEITTRLSDGTTVLDREFKNLVFRNGIADPVSILAKKAGNNLRLYVNINGVDHLADNNVTILPGPPSKFLMTAVTGGTTMKVQLADNQGNVIGTDEQWRLIFSYPVAYDGKARPPLGNNDEIDRQFSFGEVNIVFNHPFVSGPYKVEDESGLIKGSITLP